MIELLVVIALAVLILGAGALSLQNFKSNTSVESEAQQLVAILQGAQVKAAGAESDRRWGVYFILTPNHNSYELFWVDENKKATFGYTGVPGTVVDTHPLPSPISIELTGEATSSVVFSKTTGLPTQAAVIKVTNGHDDSAKHVSVSLQGKIDY